MSFNSKLANQVAEEFFHQRTNNHISLVQESAKDIIEQYPELSELWSLVLKHDASKFVEPEYTPYVRLTWDRRTDNIKTWKGSGRHTDPEINTATLHHVTTNPHHPEYWLKDKSEANVDPNDRDKSIKCIDATLMPDIAIAEMVSDWQAMSVELKTNTARDWFDKQKDVRWHFSETQCQLIDKLLSVFE